MGRRDKGTGSVFELADGRWRAVWTYRDEGDRQKRKEFERKTRGAALNAMRDWVAGNVVDTRKDLTLDELGQMLLAPGGLWEQQERQSHNTRANHYSQWNKNVRDQIGWIKLTRLQVAHLDECITLIWGSGRKRTAQAVRNLLHVILGEGRRLGYYKGSAERDIVKLARVKKRRGETKLLSFRQILELADAAEGHWVQGAVVLGGICGLRLGEIAGLTWPKLNLNEGWIEVSQQYQAVRGKGGGAKVVDRTKTDAGWRKIPIPAVALDYLRKLPRMGIFVFESSRKPGQPIYPTTIYKEARALMTKLAEAKEERFPILTFHELRHSANNVLKQMGVVAATRRDILGHSDTSVTENIYTQTIDPEIVATWARLDEEAEKLKASVIVLDVNGKGNHRDWT